MRSSRSLLALATAVGIAACGSSSSTPRAAGKVDPMVAFATCMRANGVPNFPDPGTNGNGGIEIQQRAGSGQSLSVNGVSVNAPAFQSAMQRCRSKLPNGGHPPPLSAARKQAMLKFAQCMRAHGLANFPDPTFGPGGGVGLEFRHGSGINPSSPAFRQAQAACAKYQGAAFKTQVPSP
jgi:hypothetical protein